MRQSPSNTTVSATQPDGLSGNEGPFKGNLKVKVWAIERFINKVAQHGRETFVNKPFPDGDAFKRLSVGAVVTWSQAETVTHSHATTTSLSVSPSFEATLKEIFKVGITVDGKREWNNTDVRTSTFTLTGSISNPPDPNLNPLGLDKEWTIRSVTKHKDMWRHLAKYGLNGYSNDYFNTILDYDYPEVGTSLKGVYVQ